MGRNHHVYLQVLAAQKIHSYMNTTFYMLHLQRVSRKVKKWPAQ